jgi:hypothetical protein
MIYICARKRFATLEAAKAYAEKLFAAKGVVAAIEERKPKAVKTERDKKLDLVWKHKHRDYKGRINGVRCVLIYRNGTMSVPLSDLTDAEIADALPKGAK